MYACYGSTWEVRQEDEEFKVFISYIVSSTLHVAQWYMRSWLRKQKPRQNTRMLIFKSHHSSHCFISNLVQWMFHFYMGCADQTQICVEVAFINMFLKQGLSISSSGCRLAWPWTYRDLIASARIKAMCHHAWQSAFILSFNVFFFCISILNISWLVFWQRILLLYHSVYLFSLFICFWSLNFTDCLES